jgi:hypothetical protein
VVCSSSTHFLHPYNDSNHLASACHAASECRLCMWGGGWCGWWWCPSSIIGGKTEPHALSTELAHGESLPLMLAELGRPLMPPSTQPYSGSLEPCSDRTAGCWGKRVFR